MHIVSTYLEKARALVGAFNKEKALVGATD